MSYKEKIYNKVKEIIDTKFEVEDVEYVPDIKNTKLTFGNKGLRFEGTVLFLDMRGSTEILNNHNRPVVAKINMAFFHTIVTLANSLGGHVRSFNGDGILVFFQGTTKQSLSNAVKAAMKIKYALTDSRLGINTLLEKYSTIDFGIGIDDGKILCTKVGKGGDSNTQDLIWVSNAVNKSVKIGDQRKSPYHIGISSYVYSNLTDEVKFHTKKNDWGEDIKVNMWTSSTFTYNGSTETFYYTNYYWTVA